MWVFLNKTNLRIPTITGSNPREALSEHKMKPQMGLLSVVGPYVFTRMSTIGFGKKITPKEVEALLKSKVYCEI